MYFYHRLRDCREDADAKQTTIAKYLGITQSQYHLYESGKREIPLHLAIMLADYYNISLDYLTGRTNHSENPNL
jgi:transcriptional regulator with XRE-family HTH domain